MKANDFVVLALRSPLHLLMGDTMLITLRGRKSGRKINVPVNYYRDGIALWVLSSRDRKWWRNLTQGAGVELRLHGREMRGYAEVVQDERAVAVRLADYMRHLPGSARYFGLSTENGVPDPAAIARLAKDRLFVRICVD